MTALVWAVTGIAGACLASWLWLLAARGRFWQTRPRLSQTSDTATLPEGEWPAVSIVIPARNEADIIAVTLPSRLAQDYPGAVRVLLVDDASDDGTADAARAAAEGRWQDRFTVVQARPLPQGWAGKVWALSEGVRATDPAGADYFLFTDADISLAPGTVRAMVLKAEAEDRDTVSVMARLHAKSFWERLLIPAFVYFFAKLYPFRWVGDPGRRTAAAAGGCTLVRRTALELAGGMGGVADRLIDDCALAALIQQRGRGSGPGRLWLGLDPGVTSVRAYKGPGAIWRMVARSAFEQLRYSPVVLTGTVFGMVLLYVAPPVAATAGTAALASGFGHSAGAAAVLVCGLTAWALMAASYVPVLLWHGVPLFFAPLLPAAGVLYTFMTADSARRHRAGETGEWKGRTYATLREDRKG